MITLDDVDKKILELLRKDSRTSYTTMAKSLELSEGTIRRRIKKLIQSGIIERFTIEARDENPKALVLISVEPSTPTSQITKKIANIGRIESLFEVAGSYDITLTLSGEDITSINKSIEEIRSLKGVQQTNTLFVLKDWLKLAS